MSKGRGCSLRLSAGRSAERSRRRLRQIGSADRMHRVSAQAVMEGEVLVSRMGQLERFAREHLTAAAVMVPLAAPLPAGMRALEARRILASRDFDLALVDDERLRIVTLKTLRGLSRSRLAGEVGGLAEAPHRDRLIERSMPIRDVVGKLLASAEPLLVVGDSGLTHIVTVADFAGVAGTAVVFSYLAAVDRGLNDLLSGRADEAMEAVTEKQRSDALRRRERAQAEGAALDLVDYLSMGARFTAMRQLGLDKRFGLYTREDRERMISVRNEAAHHGLSDPMLGLRAIETAEMTLEKLAAVHSAENRAAA